MNFVIVLITLICLTLLELIYFRVAEKYNIIDNPNHRSSHTNVTIRGGGVIFCLSMLLSPVYLGWYNAYFIIGLVIISLISFIDDIKTISSKIRIVLHLVSVSILFYGLGMYSLPVYWIAIAFFVVIGIINAVNFMDGINGITGSYGLITLGSLSYINSFVVNFTDSNLLLVAICSVVVFLFFNFRRNAKCFAGDVGSVSLAFIILFFLLQLIIKTQNIGYILLLLVYGLDTATTIVFRMIRGEKISEAHRSHFYQFMANEKKMNHLIVATIYAMVQLVINAFLLFPYVKTDVISLLLLIIITVAFIIIRFIVEGKNRLLTAT
ncbi:MraY family glycosyltransferase [Mucilaginibacter glaciei]|uniref:Glycosyltransferase family 4 protein n=1 Tax=Mucilaginibacter glaciei TaxID=2772109 RepID=A0A926NJE1_9SPHI|nr:glycosyltransferase family 4 protein [Mucilaginibacter glaciei]MBD1392316.1 glycosyltransferase family 4 protein [Mucilaginibacter glaciei]